MSNCEIRVTISKIFVHQALQCWLKLYLCLCITKCLGKDALVCIRKAGPGNHALKFRILSLLLRVPSTIFNLVDINCHFLSRIATNC